MAEAVEELVVQSATPLDRFETDGKTGKGGEVRCDSYRASSPKSEVLAGRKAGTPVVARKRLVEPLLKVPFALRTDLVRTGGRRRCSCFELPHAVVHVRLRHVNVFHNRTQIAVPENRHELRQFHAPFDRTRGEGVPAVVQHERYARLVQYRCMKALCLPDVLSGVLGTWEDPAPRTL
jgi:hypothetical protein